MAQIQLNDPLPYKNPVYPIKLHCLRKQDRRIPLSLSDQMSSLQNLLLQTLRVILSLPHQAYQPLTDQKPASLPKQVGNNSTKSEDHDWA